VKPSWGTRSVLSGCAMWFGRVGVYTGKRAEKPGPALTRYAASFSRHVSQRFCCRPFHHAGPHKGPRLNHVAAVLKPLTPAPRSA
jgi:hypothetical protein